MAEIFQFYSSSKDKDDLSLGLPGWRKHLSNFAEVPGGITVDGLLFPSVENAFQGEKYLCTDTPAFIHNFTCEGSIKTAVEAKKAGGKKGMLARGAVLRKEEWAQKCDGVMKKALEARFEVDPDFRRILGAVTDSGATLLHYERGGGYWGGKEKNGEILGQNKLGKMMMALPPSKRAKTE